MLKPLLLSLDSSAWCDTVYETFIVDLKTPIQSFTIYQIMLVLSGHSPGLRAVICQSEGWLLY